MTAVFPEMTEFRIEPQANGLVHLVFDCPGRSMNVFSNKAIHQLGAFAEWLRHSDARGVVLRSGKTTGFCAGADLTELGVAYDMIVAAPASDRFDMAFDHFFPLGHAIRRLETAGKPVAAAVAGVALGGGCELALGAHYRVSTTNKRAIFGLPECAVGLLPGAGGTQRMPRLIGLELGLDVLLQGLTLHGDEAFDAGLVNEVVVDGTEVMAAEAWLLSDAATSVQPWDRSGATSLAHAALAPAIERHRARELSRMLGHEPAPLAILDCVELGMMQPIDGAIRAEMSVFARLIQRAEPRNMIRTLFLGKQAHDKASRDNTLSPAVPAAATTVAAIVSEAVAACPDLRLAGFDPGRGGTDPVQDRPGQGFWVTSRPDLANALASIAAACRSIPEPLSPGEVLQLDHAVTADGSIPAYLGGISGLLKMG